MAGGPFSTAYREPEDFRRARELMVDRQIAARGVRDPHVLTAMREVPRERFVAEGSEDSAYEDAALAIAEGQTISQPLIVAMMIAAARVTPGDRVLEVGAGSGYAAAVLSRIAAHVFAIERHDSLADAARARLAALGYRNVTLRAGDGSPGWADAAPFDAILVSAGAPRVPRVLAEQLEPDGRLVAPVGEPGRQRLVAVTRTGASRFDEEDLGAVAFVPLIGEYGWRESP